MKHFGKGWVVMGMVGLAALSASAQKAGKAVIVVQPALVWADAGVPGVKTAAVDGVMSSGASHFYLSYPSGLVTPLHHHSADHYVTTISGSLVLVVDGNDHRLPPGSYFALLAKKPHVARCEGSEACVMFVDARSAWDVVPEAKAQATP